MKQFKEINNLQDLNDFCMVLNRSIIILKNVFLRVCTRGREQLIKELNGKDYYITSVGIRVKIKK